MRIKRSRFALAGVLALALGAFAVPGAAQAAKVTETAGPVAVPDAVGVIDGEGRLDFQLKGKKVKKKQVLDVNLTLNATGIATETTLSDALGGAVLVGPRGDNTGLPSVAPGAPSSLVNLLLDDQSNLFTCYATTQVNSRCNYISALNGSYTGTIGSFFNPTFKGVNPKGTWTLFLSDSDPDAEGAASITAELEVKTGKKFAKDDK